MSTTVQEFLTKTLEDFQKWNSNPVILMTNEACDNLVKELNGILVSQPPVYGLRRGIRFNGIRCEIVSFLVMETLFKLLKQESRPAQQVIIIPEKVWDILCGRTIDNHSNPLTNTNSPCYTASHRPPTQYDQ